MEISQDTAPQTPAENNLATCNDLALERNMLAAVFDCIGEAVYYTDTQRKIIAWNRAAEDLTGYKAEEVLGRYCRDILNHTDDQGQALCDISCPLLQSIHDASQVFVYQVWMRAKDGRRKPVEVNCSVIKDALDTTLGAVEIFRDRTRQLEVDKMKEEFVATVTHDLKSPLASIMGFTDLLMDPGYGEIAEKKLEFLRTMRRSGDILLSLINNIVNVSRLEAGQFNFSFDDFNFSELLQEIRETFEPSMLKAKIKLQLDCPPDAMVHADREKIRQVLHNLISNALRYTPEGGSISLKAETHNGRLQLEVADTGSGIPESEQGKLFQKFVQVKGERKGTGLGLYIVKNILQGHDSGIRLKSAPGQGTAFTFSLALAGAKPPESAKRGSFLLVGDIAESAELAVAILTAAGHKVTHATGGLEALQYLQKLKPDAVLVYRRLPDLTDAEFYHAVKMLPQSREIPLALFSAVSLPEWKEQFAAVIPLPLEKRLLLETVQHILTPARP